MKKAIIALIMAFMLCSCGNSAQESKDEKVKEALQEAVEAQAAEKAAEKEAKEKEERERELASYEFDRREFDFEYDENNRIHITYSINKTLNTTGILANAEYEDGNEGLMQADFVIMLGRIADRINEFSIVDCSATVGDDKYFYTFMNGAVQFDDILSMDIIGIPDEYAPKYLEYCDAVKKFYEDNGLK